jgi:hypothetical protein
MSWSIAALARLSPLHRLRAETKQAQRLDRSVDRPPRAPTGPCRCSPPPPPGVALILVVLDIAEGRTPRASWRC